MNHTKNYQADLESPCRELFMHSFGFVICSPFVFWDIDFSCASTVGPIQLYFHFRIIVKWFLLDSTSILLYHCPRWADVSKYIFRLSFRGFIISFRRDHLVSSHDLINNIIQYQSVDNKYAINQSINPTYFKSLSN